jgi:RimJ/RimL family protein N-acetyltransferase/N-acetylglutamate synthase-like GNAT family acetyltransferase
MKIIAETKRIYLREFILEDAIHFYNMNADYGVIKYTGDNAFSSIEEAKYFLKNYNQYALYNMGRWAVCHKVDDTFLGWCGLKYHPNQKLVEVGYRFYRTHWNKGFATESCKLSIDVGFNVLKLKEIYAHAHIDNTASHHVIEKSGLTFLKNGTYDNMPANLYKIENPNYHIEKISAIETYSVRHPELRAGRPIVDCAFDLDNEDSTFHLGLYFKEDLIGVASFMKKNHVLFNENTQYQLRGMAVLKSYQKKGLGYLLLEAGELEVAKHCSRIWFNAREVAVNFYKRGGYKIVDKPFIIEPIGKHYIMSKQLTRTEIKKGSD